MRLNRYVASSGLCSRRKADLLIKEGRVKVNDEIGKAGQEIDSKDIVKVDEKRVMVDEKRVYYILNKPKGYLTANSDERRKVFTELIKVKERIFSVGRLDYDTEGLLLLTNDGNLFNKLIHPRAEIFKKYYAIINGIVSREDLKKISEGVLLEDVRTLPCKIANINYDKDITKLEISIREGKKRQIRRVFFSMGYKVIYLQRIEIGNIKLGKLPLGKFRKLTNEEIEYLDAL